MTAARGTGAKGDLRQGAGGSDDLSDVATDKFLDADLTNERAKVGEGFYVQNALNFRGG